MEPRTAIVLAGGDGTLPRPITVQPWFVVAADSGMHIATKLGMHVDLLIGDLDSISPDDLAAAHRAGVPIEEHPSDKDATDLELALRAAMGSGADRVIIFGGWGGRFDHLIANALLLGATEFCDVELEWHSATAIVRPVIPTRQVQVIGHIGDLISLIPIAGAALGISTTGLRWPLDDDDLAPGSTRGVSNELADTEASVSLRSGVLLTIHSTVTA